MTICERVIELDRLYLIYDAASKNYVAALGTAMERNLRRKAQRTWAAYARLRNSRRGLQRGASR